MSGLTPPIVGGATTPRFVVADSTLELEIKDLGKIKDGKHIVSDKISLNLADASWIIRVLYSCGRTWFFADLYDIPEELLGKTQKVFSVSYKGRDLHTTPIISSNDKQIIHCIESHLSDYFENGVITLNFRLMITSEEDLFPAIYDPQVSRKAILGNVANMLGDPTFADFAFNVGGREFKVHMNILATASPVMRRMFTADMEEAKTKRCTVDAISAETFDQLLRYIYRSEIPKNLKAVAKPLYEAAHYYQIENLKIVCAKMINKDLSFDNALEVFDWVQPYDDFEQLKLDSWTIVKRDILKIAVELKQEPLTLKQVHAVIKLREYEQKFWLELEKEEETAEKNGNNQ